MLPRCTVFNACSRSNASAPRSSPAMHWTAHHNVVRSTSANVMAHAGTAGDQRARQPSLEPHRFLEQKVEGSCSIDAIRSVSGISAASTFSNVVAKCPVPQFMADMLRNDADRSYFQDQIETFTVSRTSVSESSEQLRVFCLFHPFPLTATSWSAQGGSRAAQPPSEARVPLTRPSTPTD